jgi:hypothetical protein
MTKSLYFEHRSLSVAVAHFCLVRRISQLVKTLALILLLVTAARAEQHPSFELDASAKRKLVERAATLKVGDSFQTVTNALGVPTVDQRLARKESSRVIGRSLKYYAVIWERGLVNELHDELVDVMLDEKNRVRSVRIKVTLE